MKYGGTGWRSRGRRADALAPPTADDLARWAGLVTAARRVASGAGTLRNGDLIRAAKHARKAKAPAGQREAGSAFMQLQRLGAEWESLSRDQRHARFEALAQLAGRVDALLSITPHEPERRRRADIDD